MRCENAPAEAPVKAACKAYVHNQAKLQRLELYPRLAEALEAVRSARLWRDVVASVPANKVEAKKPKDAESQVKAVVLAITEAIV